MPNTPQPDPPENAARVGPLATGVNAAQRINCPQGLHDWRVDPFTMLTSHPARRRVVCVDCGLVSSRPMYAAGPEPTPDPNDPRTWREMSAERADTACDEPVNPCPFCDLPGRLMGSGERYICDNQHTWRVLEDGVVM